MLEIITDTADNVVAASAKGTVTAEDYKTVLMPAVDAKLKTHDKIRFLAYLGPEFDGYDAGAMWQDTKLGMEHLKAWEKIAVVTDAHKIKDAVKMFRFLVPGKVKLFSNDEMAQAEEWLAE